MITLNGITFPNESSSFFPSGAATYNQSGVASGMQYSVRSWHSNTSKFAFIGVDLKGTATAEIDISLPSLAYQLDIVGSESQSLFLTAWEYTEGMTVSPEGLRGALIVSREGSVKLKISAGSAMTSGSSETKWFKIV